MNHLDYIKIQQEVSFKNLASSLGIDQFNLVESMKAGKIAVLEKRLAVTKDSWFSDLDKEFADFDAIRAINSIDGVTALSRNLNKSYHDVVISTAAELFPAFEKAGLFHKEDHKEILSFLQSIPIITLFESDGGPYVTKLDKEGITYVVRNEHLDLVLEHLITPVVINSTAFGSKEQAKYFTDNYDFEKLSRIYLSMARINRENLLWKLPEEVIKSIDPLFEKSVTVYYYGMILYWSMQYFINFHEYAHVLCNHFSSSKGSIQMEIEADNFAINALYYNALKQLHIDEKDIDEEMVNDKLTFMITSPLWLFLFFSANNIEQGLIISKTHPHPLLRLDSAKRTLDLLTRNCSPLNRKVSQLFTFIEGIVREMLKDLSEAQLLAIYGVDHYFKTPLFIYDRISKEVAKYEVKKATK